jgi:hypothetical protein
MKEVEKEFVDSTVSASTAEKIGRPKSEQIFATESLLEEVPFHDTTLEQTDMQNRSRESVRMSYQMRDSIGNESMNDPAQNPDVKYLQEMAKL